MTDYEQLDNKKFAYSCLALLNDQGCLNEAEILILTSEDECKRIFHRSKFPILLEVPLQGTFEDAEGFDELDRQRFYKEKIYAAGRAFVVSNHWYGPGKSMTDNRTPFLKWVTKKQNNKSASEVSV